MLPLRRYRAGQLRLLEMTPSMFRRAVKSKKRSIISPKLFRQKRATAQLAVFKEKNGKVTAAYSNSMQRTKFLRFHELLHAFESQLYHDAGIRVKNKSPLNYFAEQLISILQSQRMFDKIKQRNVGFDAFKEEARKSGFPFVSSFLATQSPSRKHLRERIALLFRDPAFKPAFKRLNRAHVNKPFSTSQLEDIFQLVQFLVRR